MLWDLLIKALFLRMLYIAGSLFLLYFYAKNLDLFRFENINKVKKELDLKLSILKKLNAKTNYVFIPNENNDGLKKEVSNLKKRNEELEDAISLLIKEKHLFENDKINLDSKKEELQKEKSKQEKNNVEFNEKKKEAIERKEFIKNDLSLLKAEIVNLKKKEIFQREESIESVNSKLKTETTSSKKKKKRK